MSGKLSNKTLKYALFCLCVVLVIVAVLFLLNNTKKENEPKENDKIPPSEQFVIEDGVLIKYNGREEKVVIPDEVKRIAASAFKDNAAAVVVRTLSIGKNVETVDDTAFDPLSSLKKITVDPENPYYEAENDVLIKKDGVIAFASIGNYSYIENGMADSLFLGVLENADKHNEAFRASPRIRVGSVTLNLRREFADDRSWYFVNSVEAFGKTVDLTEIGEITITGNGLFKAFEAETVFVTGFVGPSANGETYFITENSVIKVRQAMDYAGELYNQPNIFFYSENGKIFYNRIPHKYLRCVQIFGGVFEECAGKDELYCEVGEAIINGDKIEYVPQKTITVEEHFDLDAEYLKWCDTMRMDPNTISMDEYLEENSKKFERAK